MDVEKTGRNVTEKKLFSFTESTADHFFIREGKDRGRIVHRIWVGGGGEDWGFETIFAGYEPPASLPAKFRKCVSCVAWRFWPASDHALPLQSPRGIAALARPGLFARPTKTAMIRTLENVRPHSSNSVENAVSL